MARKYVIINSEDVSHINFTEVEETSVDTLRWNNNNTKTFFKFSGDTPSFFLNLKETTTCQYNYEEMLAILNDINGEWFIEDTTSD